MIFLLEENRMRKLLFLLLTVFTVLSAFAKELPAAPNPPKLVNDFTGTLSAQEIQMLETKLLAYSDSTSTQIAIVIENSLEGEDAFDYSQRLAQSWQIGQKGKNNGLLIYIAIDDHKIRIQSGYGMEGTITDALSKRIIEENIKPYFKQKQYFQGLDEATSIIMRAASGEYINDQPRKKGKKDTSIGTIILFIIIIVVVGLFSNKGGGRGRRVHGGMSPFFGTFGSGGFSSGGGGGGGFGGFGGGGFGGGGAGGSW